MVEIQVSINRYFGDLQEMISSDFELRMCKTFCHSWKRCIFMAIVSLSWEMVGVLLPHPILRSTLQRTLLCLEHHA